MNYMQTAGRALSIAWRHKYLWLLALLAGEGGAAFSLSDVTDRFPSTGAGRPQGMPTDAQITGWLSGHLGVVAAAALAALAIALTLLVVSVIANGAVIRAAADHDGSRPSRLGSAWASGVAAFWPVFLLRLIEAVVYAAVVIPIGALAYVAAHAHANIGLEAATGFTAVLLVLIALPLGLVFGVVVLLAKRAVVLDGRSTGAALASAFGLVRRRFGRVALWWLIMAAAGVVAGIVMIIAVAVLAVPLVGIVAGAYAAGGDAAAIGIAAFIAPVWIVMAIVVSAAANSFFSVAWTLAYMRFDEERRPVPAAQALPA